MNINDLRRWTLTWAKTLVCGGALWLAPAAHAAGWLDALFGKGGAPTEAAKAGPGQRVWAIHEFTTLALVPREAGSAPNRQPVQLTPEALRQLLARVQFVGRSGAQPLFAADELAELAAPLAQALERAGPGDDVLLLSSSRREGGVLVAPTAITARLFVQGEPGQGAQGQGETLQLIVHDARLEFYDQYRGTNIAPRFVFGSRGSAGTVSLRSAGASNARADWLALPLQTTAGAPAVPAAMTPAPLAAPAAAPVATPSPRKPLDAAGADDIERRLETLKRLREKNLISEEEYQLKRREILQLL